MQLTTFLSSPLAQVQKAVVTGAINVRELLLASEAEPTTLTGPFLTCFTPSLNRVPDETVRALGPIGPFAADLSLRRVWTLGPHVYQPLALYTSLVGTQYVDLLVRRKYTLEPAAVLVDGSPLVGILRALDQLAFMRRQGVSGHLLPEVSKRNVMAGQVQVDQAHQAMVVATPSVYAAAGAADLEAVRALKAQLEGTPYGFRFVLAEGSGDDLSIRLPPAPWQEASLVRNVTELTRQKG